jgi:hypothetical protein
MERFKAGKADAQVQLTLTAEKSAHDVTMMALIDTQGTNASLHDELADKTEMLAAATSKVAFLNKRLLATKYAQVQLARQRIQKLRTPRAHTMAEAEATIIAAEVVDARLTLDR